jgi:hypothetical protein
MANNIYFNRSTRVFLTQDAVTWEIPVLNGYTFTQGANTSEVTVNEMSSAAGTSRRGRVMFTDSQAPADWSFDTYVRPTIVATKHRAVEEPLWANFVAANSWSGTAWDTNTVTSVSTTSLDIEFDNSNKTELGTFDLTFVMGESNDTDVSFDPGTGATANTAYGVKIYRIAGASVNEVSISFDIDGIAMLSWSGNGATLREVATAFTPAGTIIRNGISQTNNFIRNRLTQADVIRTDAPGGAKTYEITLTGGSLTLSNNLTYLTPEVLGRVNVPLGHVTGTRTISGTITCYLDATDNGSAELFADLATDLGNTRNYFDLTLYVGGKASSDNPRAPGMAISIPSAHMVLPSIETNDALSMNIEFSALPTDMGTTDEIDLIRYIGVAA